MPKRKLQPGQKRRALNVSLNKIVVARAFQVAEELGYGASEIVETMMEKLWEERQRIPKRKRGDPLQITFFDRVTEPEPKKKK